MGWSGSSQTVASQALEPASAGNADAGIDTARSWITKVDLVDVIYAAFVPAQRPAASTPVLSATCNGFEDRMAGQRGRAQKEPPTTRGQV